MQSEAPQRSFADTLVRRCAPAAAQLIFISFFINILALTSPLYMVQLYERVLSSLHIETLIMLTLMAGAALAASAALEAVRSAMSARLGRWFEGNAAPTMVRASLSAALSDTMTARRFSFDLRSVRDFIASGTSPLFDLPFAPIFFAAAFVLHPALGWFTVGSAVVLLAITYVSDIMTRSAALRYTEASHVGDATLDQGLRNAEAVRAMGMQQALVDRLNVANDRAQSQRIRAHDVSSAFGGIGRFARYFAQSLVLALGAWLVIRGELSPGLMIAASIVLSRALAPIDQILGSWRLLHDARMAFRRLRTMDAWTPAPGAAVVERPEARLTVAGISYAPANGREILKNVRFDVRPGQVLAIIGPSGAGKTTLAKIIVGAKSPTSGTMTLGGLDMRTAQIEVLGRHIGYLPQEVELFDGSVRENIARMRVAPEAAPVEEAARDAGVHNLICAFSDGYETQIGASGRYLSGGQRQRVGLARAFYGHPSLIVLDEPNAHLDQAGEKSLINALIALKSTNAATIIICHSPSMLAAADAVLLLIDGEVKAFGARDDVLALLGMDTNGFRERQAIDHA